MMLIERGETMMRELIAAMVAGALIGCGGGDSNDTTADGGALEPAAYERRAELAVSAGKTAELVVACDPDDTVTGAECFELDPAASSPLVIDTNEATGDGWRCVGRNTAGCSSSGACYSPSPIMVVVVRCER